jgi:uncharacterized protein (DUF433 family)
MGVSASRRGSTGGACLGQAGKIDWTNCPDVERTPGTLSGAWRIKGTRIPVQAIIDNAEDCTPEEIAGPDIYPDIPLHVLSQREHVMKFPPRSEADAKKASSRKLLAAGWRDDATITEAIEKLSKRNNECMVLTVIVPDAEGERTFTVWLSNTARSNEMPRFYT